MPKGQAAPLNCLLLYVLDGAQGVRDLWRALVCQGYDICDQAVYGRLDHAGTEPLQVFFECLSRMLAAWVQPLLEGLLTGTLLLFDLGYFGFEWLDELTARSLWYVCRLREKTSYTHDPHALRK